VSYLFVCRFTTITYTGDGAASQAITGAGFPPRALEIYAKGNQTYNMGLKTDQDGVNALYFAGGLPAFFNYAADVIISLDPDGFTVGDGTGAANVCNAVGVVYTAILWG